MMVTFVSQCQKKALNRTRRVLDAFANRIGDNTWQTIITQEGLQAVKKLLRKTATKNTAVSCHWIRSRSRSELIWVVGNRMKFDSQGRVPVNRTNNALLKTELDDNWNTGSVISLLAAIAGLFHDVGKANLLFEQKLRAEGKLSFEPYRHEWVSLRIFEAFVIASGKDDQAWLTKLVAISPKDDKTVLKHLKQDNLAIENKDRTAKHKNPFRHLPPLAKTIGWLILSHHRLPKFQPAEQRPHAPDFEHVDKWLNDSLHWHWNALNAQSDKIKPKAYKDNWTFKNGTPLSSKTWCEKAHQVAKRALNDPLLLSHDWFKDPFTSHLARLALMLSDHVYSAGGVQSKWQDTGYACYANTDKEKKLKQKLDEHNIGVAHNAYFLTKELATFKRNLPSMGRIKGLESHSTIEKFKWQKEAYKLASSLKTTVKKQGFFGVNMASTGCGKTLANLKIMYALADDVLGARVSIALGLRTLTMQTSRALSALLSLADDDIATMVGSQAVKQLDAYYQAKSEENGSESSGRLIDYHQAIHYEGQLYDGNLKKWLDNDPRLLHLISAPILVSTIDHLMPATEGERGGKQIAPMLRLLTSDLILDEPDDFNLEDLPALSRMVNWAGMLGSNVLLSSATLPPSIVNALFDAYLSGRKIFDQVCGQARTTNIHCAWFDETSAPQTQAINSLQQFQLQHHNFIDKRCKQLEQFPAKRIAELLTVQPNSTNKQDVVSAMSEAIVTGINELHDRYHLTHEKGKTVSIGLVRMANINPMVAISKQITQMTTKPNQRIHFCCYHSRHPLLVRSQIEQVLDRVLKRNDEQKFWQQPEINDVIQNYPEQHHIFVVFATAVAEVGRDHDYDWAIVEPSSMRSIIQLAGRVWRHRDKQCDKPNIMIMNKNYKALIGSNIAYCQPGFESKHFPLATHDISELVPQHFFRPISAQARIKFEHTAQADTNLIALEHVHLQDTLFGDIGKIKHHAANWWQQPIHWNAEMQRHTPFRRSQPETKLVFFMEDELDDEVPFIDYEDGDEPVKSEIKTIDQISYASGVNAWMNLSIKPLLQELIDEKQLNWRAASITYTELRVTEDWAEYVYEQDFGLYRAL